MLSEPQHILLVCPLMNSKRRVGQKYMMHHNHHLFYQYCVCLGGQFW